MMLLSEAILLGSMMKPQADGWFLAEGKTCAQGAALDAVGRLTCKDNDYKSNVAMKDVMSEVWPWASTKLLVEIATRNNGGEKRESIAAWVAEQEVRLGITDDEKWRDACKHVRDYPDAEQMIPDKKEEVKEGEHAPV